MSKFKSEYNPHHWKVDFVSNLWILQLLAADPKAPGAMMEKEIRTRFLFALCRAGHDPALHSFFLDIHLRNNYNNHR